MGNKKKKSCGSGDDVHVLARRCHGYVGADLRAICLSAARAALRRGEAAVNLELCMGAIRAVPPSALKERSVYIEMESFKGSSGTSQQTVHQNRVIFLVRYIDVSWGKKAKDI
eukprot:2624249-Amphidinium_carterae.1